MEPQSPRAFLPETGEGAMIRAELPFGLSIKMDLTAEASRTVECHGPDMTRLLPHFSLPLLGKELIEQAARKRTYVVRVLYAALLFFAAWLFFFETLRAGSTSPLAVLGRGRDMFEVLVNLQFAGVYLFMPAITCGVLTQEKERSSLQLLFLTRLGPWTILFEKLLGRLVPMLSFLLLSLPLLGFAYTLGGISPQFLWSGVWTLVLAAVQMGTLALMCSAFCRTTVGAFIWSYVLALAMLIGPTLALVTLDALGVQIESFANGLGTTPGGFAMMGLMLYPFCGVGFLGMSSFSGTVPGWALLVHTAIILSVSAAFLGAARLCIVRRAFVPPRNLLLEFFRLTDRALLRLNGNRLTRGVVLAADDQNLPDLAPVAWRETNKRALGRTRYLIRLLLLIEAPVLACCLLLCRFEYNTCLEFLALLQILLWIVAALVVAVQSASLIAGERSHQTLEVLCTTPLAGCEIIRQKIGGVYRLILTLLLPFFTFILFEVWQRASTPVNYTGGTHAFNASLYVGCSVLAVGIFLPMVAWLSLLVGLKLRSQTRSIIGSTSAIVAWCVIPVVFVTIPMEIWLGHTGIVGRETINCSALLSPAMVIAYNELTWLHELGSEPWRVMLVSFTGYAGLLLIFRRLCLTRADRWLGRVQESVVLI
jgi:ABC-type transport system involved in multi-copper enzyme maturation permease subunit